MKMAAGFGGFFGLIFGVYTVLFVLAMHGIPTIPAWLYIMPWQGSAFVTVMCGGIWIATKDA